MKIFFLLAAALLAPDANAQLGLPWRKTPTIVLIAAEGDPRIALVNEAITYWNRVFEETGSAFRLPAATPSALPIPEQALQEMSSAIVGVGRRPSPPPQALRDLPGDLTIMLAHSAFVSFAGPFDPDGKMVIGIRGTDCVAAEPAERRAQRHRSRGRACARPRTQCRPDDADVRPPGAVPAAGFRLTAAPYLPADRRRAAPAPAHVSA
jgi:hypothetical protein